MGESLLSVGLDVGTTTTQMVVSRIFIENKAGSFTVPELAITDRQLLYKSKVYFTPLISGELVDGERLRQIVAEEYRSRGIAREMLAACENWAREQGCREFASDCELSNAQSLRFHLKVGFTEANRIICFTKRL